MSKSNAKDGITIYVFVDRRRVRKRLEGGGAGGKGCVRSLA